MPRALLYRQYPASTHVLRSDRIVDEVQAAGGDALLICELFGLGIKAATRYTAASGQQALPDVRNVQPRDAGKNRDART